MTQEDKDLLLKDLCARLPYGVKIQVKEWATLDTELKIGHIQRLQNDNIELKPYLRPLSSMTDDEMVEFNHLYYDVPVIRDNGNAYRDTKVLEWMHIDWYNIHHFDYRGLIPKGLAIAVTEENNPYEK